MEDMALIKIDEAKQALAEANSISTVLEIRNRAMAASAYAQAKGFREAADVAKEAQLRAERRAGEFLADGIQRGGDRKSKLHDATLNNSVKLEDIGIEKTQSSRWQSIASIPEDKFEHFIAERRNDGKELTQTGLLQFAKAERLGVHFSSADMECYTPKHIIERVISVMGQIDLDPCSNSRESPNVPASFHYTSEDDGLVQDWFGRVYMNPPYGDKISEWVRRLCSEWELGHLSEAIALVPSRTDTEWFRLLRSFPHCFVWGRLKFSDFENSAPFPSMLVYLGSNVERFAEVFSDIGDVYQWLNLTSQKSTVSLSE